MPPRKRKGDSAVQLESQSVTMNPTVILERYHGTPSSSLSLNSEEDPHTGNLQTAHRSNLQRTFDHVKQINEIAKLIPEFDGSNMPVTEFIRECREISELLSEDDSFVLIKILKTKIIGPAKVHLGSRKFQSIQDLLNCLKTAYFPKSNLLDIQTEMSRCRQQNSETALDFGLRIQQILSTAIDVIVDGEGADGPLAPVMIDYTNKIAVQFYVTGVRLDIGQQILCQHFDNLDQAIATAVKMERKLDEMYKLHSDNHDNSVTDKKRVRQVFPKGHP